MRLPFFLARTKKESKEQELESKAYELTDEIKKQMHEQCIKFGHLSRWMSENFNAIFEAAPKNALYAVGVYPKEGRMPQVYYFKKKLGRKGALDFRINQNNLGKTTDWIYKHQGDFVYMF